MDTNMCCNTSCIIINLLLFFIITSDLERILSSRTVENENEFSLIVLNETIVETYRILILSMEY